VIVLAGALNLRLSSILCVLKKFALLHVLAGYKVFTRFNRGPLYSEYCCYAVTFFWGVVIRAVLPPTVALLFSYSANLLNCLSIVWFFPVYLFLYVGCIAVFNSISMPSKRPKKTWSAASASSSTSAHPTLFVRGVRGRGPPGCHGHCGHRACTGLIEGRPAAFLSAGLWYAKDHLGSICLILCSIAPF